MNITTIITITCNHCPKTVDKLAVQLSEFGAKLGYLGVERFIPDPVTSGLSIYRFEVLIATRDRLHVFLRCMWQDCIWNNRLEL